MRDYLSRLLSEGDGEPSLRRVLCLCAFLFGCALCLLGLRYEISPGVRDVAIFIVTAAFGAVTAGRFAEAIDGGKE